MNTLATQQPWAAPKTWVAMISKENIATDKPFSIRPVNVKNGVAVIDVSGVLMRDSDNVCEYFGGASTVRIASQIQEVLADDTVNAILLHVNSPGGMVNGTAELADIIYQARQKKPVVAYIAGDGFSAAYWISSQANKIIAHESAGLGAIGVCVPVDDKYSDWIVSGVSPNKYPELAKAESIAQMQVFVDSLGEIFVRAVARGRGVTEQEVVSRFGGGDIFIASKAVQLGLCDAVGSFDSAFIEAETLGKSNNKDALSAEVGRSEEGKGGNEMAIDKDKKVGQSPTAEMVDTNEITKDWLFTNMPDLFEQIRNEGAEGEQKRQMALDEVAPENEEEKSEVAQARKDRKITAEALSFRLRQLAQAKQKAKIEATLAQRQADSDAVKVPINGDASLPQTPAGSFDDKVKMAMLKKKGIKT